MISSNPALMKKKYVLYNPQCDLTKDTPTGGTQYNNISGKGTLM